MSHINIILCENKEIYKDKFKVKEKEKIQMKKPEKLLDFLKLMLSKFYINNPGFLIIKVVDWDGVETEINDEDDYKESGEAFKVIYDEKNPN